MLLFVIFKTHCEVLRQQYLKIIRQEWMKGMYFVHSLSETCCLHFPPIQNRKNQNSIESQMKARKNTNVPGSSSILFLSISVKIKGKFENLKGPGSQRVKIISTFPSSTRHIVICIFYGGYTERLIHDMTEAAPKQTYSLFLISANTFMPFLPDSPSTNIWLPRLYP